MRRFSLYSSEGVLIADLTTTDQFFHTVSGLGYSRDDTYKDLTSSFVRVNRKVKQGAIKGTLTFANNTPYHSFKLFMDTVQKNRTDEFLIKYDPFSDENYLLGTSTPAYFKRVVISDLEVGELDKYGVLNVEATFTPLGPWYHDTTYYYTPVEDEFGTIVLPEGDTPLDPETVNVAAFIFDCQWGPESGGLKFMETSMNEINLFETCQRESPSKLRIQNVGDTPITSPSWSYYEDNSLTSTGLVRTVIDPGMELVVDNTSYPYEIAIYNYTTGDKVRDVYHTRDFSRKCFIDISAFASKLTVSAVAGAPNMRIVFTVRGCYDAI